MREERRLPTWLILAALFILALGMRVAMIARSQATARDAVGFVKYAHQLEHQPWTKAINEGDHPPGYPLAVLAASYPIRWMIGDSPESWLLAAQSASAICGALLVFPIYLLGRDLGGRLVGFIAAAVFQCLPMWVRLTSDGLSEALFLLLSATAMYFSVRGLRLDSRWSLFTAGVFAGAAYLTRPEGLEIALATVAALWLAVILGRESWTGRKAMIGSIAVSIGLAVMMSPYVAVTGRLTKKNTAKVIFGDQDVDRTGWSAAPPKQIVAAFYVAAKDGDKIAWGFKTLGSETLKSLHFAVAGWAIAGLLLAKRHVRSVTAWSLLLAMLVIHTLLLWRMAFMIGYLSERHTALYALIACVPAAVAIVLFSKKLAQWLPVKANVLAGLAVVGLLLGALPSLAKPMHSNRAGHCAAGQWLAKNADPQAGIMDPFGWGYYYAGRVFHDESPKEPKELYVIIELTDNQHSRLPQLPAAKANAAMGTMVYHWPEDVEKEKAVVAVYRVEK